MYKRKRISTRMHFISITKWNEIKRNQERKSDPLRSILHEDSRSGNRSFHRACSLGAHLFCRRRAYFHWRTKVTRSPCHGGIRRAARRPWDSTWYRAAPGPLQMVVMKQKEARTRTHTSLDWFSALSTRNTVGFACYRIASTPQCCKKRI